VAAAKGRPVSIWAKQLAICLQSHESSLNQELVVEYNQAEGLWEDVEARLAAQEGPDRAQCLAMVQRTASSSECPSCSVAVRTRQPVPARGRRRGRPHPARAGVRAAALVPRGRGRRRWRLKRRQLAVCLRRAAAAGNGCVCHGCYLCVGSASARLESRSGFGQAGGGAKVIEGIQRARVTCAQRTLRDGPQKLPIFVHTQNKEEE
jgi:hypothetical protein